MNSDINNTKKILCNNIIVGKKCNYGNKCLYAHSLDEQNVLPIREKAYNLLSSNDNLDDINLIEDGKLYETLCQLTKVCSSCEKQTCSGGKNCRNGAISKAFKICYDDLVYGNCKYTKCNFVHLTDRGLVPYLKQKNKVKHEKLNMLKNNMSKDNPSGPKNYFQYKFNCKKTKSTENVKSEENNLMEYLFMPKNMNVESDDSYADENVDDVIDYLNNDNESSDESIFLV
jgi:hypothetical protein